MVREEIYTWRMYRCIYMKRKGDDRGFWIKGGIKMMVKFAGGWNTLSLSMRVAKGLPQNTTCQDIDRPEV